MQTVYLVTGSEDGPIGVFGSVTKAQQCVERYIGRNANSADLAELRALRKGEEHCVTIYEDDDGCFCLNGFIKAMTVNYDSSNI